MGRYDIDDFRGWFEQVIDPADDCIVVYSGIWTFGHKFGIPVKEVPHLLVEQILEAVGPERTLLFPAYTYTFAKTRAYSPRESIPETGVLPRAVLERFPARRTRSALNSFLAMGPLAEVLSGVTGETLWGDDSLKGILEKRNARMVTLGLPWKDSLGFLHRIEEAAAVPYRYFKTFHGEWQEGGQSEPWAETMYVRSMEVVPEFEWAKVDRRLRETGRIVAADAPVFIESAGASDIVATGFDLLADDPYALLTNADAVRTWVNGRKTLEMDALRAVEPTALDYADRQDRAAG
jgi:aminoglycoside N3'-acetyltransferase